MAGVSNTMQGYIAIISKEPGSVWGVHFPDLPGCTSAGTTMEEAMVNAGRALRLWAEDEAELPRVSTLDSLRKRSDVREDLASDGMAVFVPLIVANRKQRYNIMLDPSLVEGIDQAAKAAGVSRSDFIAHAASQTLEAKAGAVTINRSRRKKKASGIQSVRRRA
jgi:predicted RNase H-like HicB family nuclease